ncbi:permease prefix domain 1-containing protein [Nocardia asteroides]|uniref:permease prefix domain 1-containing protein n=1 Tax=Nocardia asteroides TaxID=1824 RepID=UPI001E2BF82B|nr:permease prefix domain 1-containing protein [Nocardia asteroides]UGT61168.1 permease prefix domain 1-containing protein [Nocardia asteroides]
MTDVALDAQIGQWRGYVVRHRAISAADADEMEDHLRDQIAELGAAGLEPDEAFLVAVKRMGRVDDISREFAREHSDRLWKQLVLPPEPARAGGRKPDLELLVVLALGLGAGLTLELVRLLEPDDNLVARNIGLFVLPFLAIYFAWKRRMPLRAAALLPVPFVLAGVLLNVYPFVEDGDVEVVVVVHAPIVLWLAVGLAYLGGEWRSDRRRMDFVRFTGEWVVYLTLLALGGGVLIGLTVGAFDAVGLDAEDFVVEWVLPIYAGAALVVAAWLVEAKQSVVENIAPVLTRVFTPLTILMLLALLVALAASGNVADVDRGLLITMDAILILVFGLVLYAVSARDPLRPPDLFDHLQLLLIALALAADLLMLAVMTSRIAEFGATANKTAALGMNLVLLVNLAGAAYLAAGFLRRRRGFAAIERWQTGYLPVFGIWAAVVLALWPPLFDFA